MSVSTCASDLLDLAVSDGHVGIFAADTLTSAADAGKLSRAGHTLVYGFKADRPEDEVLLANIVGGVVKRRSTPAAGVLELNWTSQMAVLSPALAEMRTQIRPPVPSFHVFDLDARDHARRVETLALLDGAPWFLRVNLDGRWVYLLGIESVPDADQIVSSADAELALVSASLSMLLFLRAHHPADVWAPGQLSGNFIIDDPLLRPRYGFVRHENLARQLNQTGGAATIAFIPWNARRSAKRTVELYKRTSALTICAHGYEHIADEFSSSDGIDLQWRTENAMRAMCLHRELTGVDFEPVMVFPQGRFSALAFEALSSGGFLAAVNSTFLATDREHTVRLKELLEPAVTAYGPIPLFRRRSSDYIDRFRYDSVLGKPLLLVEHHDYFDDGGVAFSHVFEAVRKIAPSVLWAPLGDIVRRAHLMRAPRDGATQIKFYCREFHFSPGSSGIYEFSKRENGAEVRSITVNGHPVEFVVRGDIVRFTAALNSEAGEIAIAVHTRRPVVSGDRDRHRSSNVGVAVRRYCSEIRDNYIDTSSHVRWWRSVVRGLRAAVGGKGVIHGDA